jgi:hypothetical protein
MTTIGQLRIFTFVSLAILACSSKSTSLQPRDGATEQGSGTGFGGNGSGGTSSIGSGGTSLPGTGGVGGTTVDGSGGSGGVAQDAEPADGARDASGEPLAVDPNHDGPDAASDDGVARDGIAVVDLGTPDTGLADGVPPGCGAAGDPCAGQTGCSSGDSVDIACRSVLVCQNGTLSPANLLFVRCGATAGSPCPATQPTEGAACTLAAHTCSYPTGTCTCATGCEGGTDAGPCQKPTTWHCDPSPPAGCPVQAPQLGLPCANEKVSCRYGGYCAQYQVTCQSGYWEPYGFMSFGGCA